MARNTLGPEDIDTCYFMQQLAWCLLGDNRVQESLDLIEKLQILKIDDPDTDITYAEALSLSGNHQKAMEVAINTMTRMKDPVGTDNDVFCDVKNVLANAYASLNRFQEEAELREQILDFYSKIFGTKNRKTIRVMSNLAISYKDLGRWQDGLRIMTEAADISRSTYGDDDPTTIKYMGKLNRMQARLAKTATKSSES